MSGIVGIVNLTGSPIAPLDIVRRMSAAQAHRGPHELVVELPGVAFANRSHSALETDDVISGKSGHRIVCVCDGRLFNADALCGEAAISRATDGSPALILPSLWRKHGIAMCDRLRGQFAFAIWDER